MATSESTSADPPAQLRPLIALLDHSRAMVNFASEVRMRNFNFFVVLTAAMLAGVAKLPPEWTPVVGLAGAFTSLVFFGLDVRGNRLLKRSLDQLSVLEPRVWEQAGISGWSPVPRQTLVSHKWLYRTFIVIVGLASIGASLSSTTLWQRLLVF